MIQIRHYCSPLAAASRHDIALSDSLAIDIAIPHYAADIYEEPPTHATPPFHADLAGHKNRDSQSHTSRAAGYDTTAAAPIPLRLATLTAGGFFSWPRRHTAID
jgi:hypothetical protein